MELTHFYRTVPIYYAPNGCEALNKSINDSFGHFKGVRDTLYRSTEDYNRFLEKIRIFEDGFDDRAIELAKFFIKYNNNNNIPDDWDVFYDCYFPDRNQGELGFRFKDADGMRKELALIGRDGYENYLREITENEKYNLHSLCENIDEKWLFARIGVD